MRVGQDPRLSFEAPSRPLEGEELQALIEEAWQRTHRRRRRIRAALATLLTAVIVVGIAIADDRGGSTRSGVRRPTAGARGGARSRGDYRYTRTLDPYHRETIETWIGVDGTWRYRVTDPTSIQSVDMLAGGDDLFPPQANATASIAGALTNIDNPGDGLFTHRQLQTLPSNVIRLRERIMRAISAQVERDLEAFVHPGPRRGQRLARARQNYRGPQLTATELTAISDLYSSPIPQHIRDLLYQVAASLPEVQRTDGARDGLGRLGVALTGGGIRLIFDRRTGALLSGTYGTVLAKGEVASIKAVPRGVRPIPSTTVTPPRLWANPTTGATRSTFSVSFPAPPGATASQPAPAVFALLFGPTGRGCFFWRSRPPFARIPAGTITVHGGSARNTYRIAPGVIGRSTWCPGRYQLMISVTPPHSSITQINRATRSVAAVYFDVR